MTTVEPVKRGRGRPSIGPMLSGVRLEQAMHDELDAIAAAEGSPRSDVVRDLLAEALAARRKKSGRAGR